MPCRRPEKPLKKMAAKRGDNIPSKADTPKGCRGDNIPSIPFDYMYGVSASELKKHMMYRYMDYIIESYGDTSRGTWILRKKEPCPIKDIKIRKLLNLKLRGGEHFPALKKKYFNKLKKMLTRKKRRKEKKKNEKENYQQLRWIFTHLKESALISWVLPELISLITTELKTVATLKPSIILRALYCLFHNDNVMIEKNVSFNIMCTSSLKKFLANSLKCGVLGYLLKEIAVDILCELCCTFKPKTAMKLLACDFHYLQAPYEDFYGSTVAWLVSMTPETRAKLVHWKALYSKTFLGRSLNFPKLYARLIYVCEYHVHCLPTQIADVTVNETHSLYNLKLVNQIFYNLMRHEVIYTPISYMPYKPRISKPFQFSDLLVVNLRDFNMLELLEPPPRHERDMPDVDCRPPPKKKLKRSPKNFYASPIGSPYIECGIIWNVFSCYGTYIDLQFVFYGNLSYLPDRMCDIYRWEKADIRHVSTSSSDRNPFDMELEGEEYYNPFLY